MTLDAGDWRVATLQITPADGTTAAVLTVVAPDGTTSTPTVDLAVADGVGTATAAGYELATAGEWVERWAVTGTGRSKERAVLLVAPDPSAALAGVRIYATTTDYANHLLSAPPSGSRRALREASRVVDEILRTAIYDTDDDSMPTDAAVIAAMRDATCTQAEYARAAGDANVVGAGQVSSFTIGGISVTKGSPQGQATASDLPPHWSPTAWRILRDVPVDKLCWDIGVY